VTAAIISASVALVVAILTPTVTSAVASLRARRQAVDDKFDAAITALLRVQAARHFAADTPGVGVRAKWPQDAQASFHIELQQRGITHYIERTVEAREALAALDRYVPEIRPAITNDWELREQEEPRLGFAIESRRREALKSERLFRQRRPPTQGLQIEQ
jgi:hypothetical protein